MRRLAVNRRNPYRLVVKHDVTFSDLNASGATNQFHTIVQAVDNPVPTTSPTDVADGAHVFKLLLTELQFSGAAAFTTSNSSPVRWYLWKNPNGSLTRVTPGTEGNSNIRNFVLQSGMEMVSTSQIKRVGDTKIYKRLTRMQKGDIIEFVYYFVLNAPATNCNVCAKIIFKEYRA